LTIYILREKEFGHSFVVCRSDWRILFNFHTIYIYIVKEVLNLQLFKNVTKRDKTIPTSGHNNTTCSE